LKKDLLKEEENSFFKSLFRKITSKISLSFDLSNYVNNIMMPAIFTFPIAEPAEVACFPHLPTSPRGKFRLSSSGRLSMSLFQLFTRSFSY
jgi:hypothetical protein